MRKRRRIFYLATGFTTGLGLAAACGFPDPQLVSDEGGTPETGGDASAPNASAPDGSAMPDVDPPIVDASGEKPSIDANCDLCDCDGDGFVTYDAAVCPDAGPRLDCDDLDSRANPDSGFVKEQPTADTRGDWNCDKVVQGEIAGVLVDCSKYQTISGCNVEGFVGNPGCGEEGTYVVCASGPALGACKIGANEKKTQGCK